MVRWPSATRAGRDLAAILPTGRATSNKFFARRRSIHDSPRHTSDAGRAPRASDPRAALSPVMEHGMTWIPRLTIKPRSRI